MIIKGSARGQSASDVDKLARHLTARDNEAVAVLELKGVAAAGLAAALADMHTLSLSTRTRRGLYHASISADPVESRRMTARQWFEAADELERHLGLTGHQRALVRHIKKGRVHLHVVWSRVHPDTLKVARDGWTYARHEACARALEKRWRLKAVPGAHSRPKGIERPGAAKRHKDWQAEVRTGISVADVSAVLRAAWDASADGRSFAVAVRLAGLTLARGRRGVIAVDPAGVPHALGRRLGLKAADVRHKLIDLDPATLPTVEDIKAAPQRPPSSQGRIIMPKKPRQFAAAAQVRRRPRPGAPLPAPTPPDADYWQRLGHEVETVAGVLVVLLSGGVRLEDRGDHMVLQSTPTPEANAALIAAAKSRGWTGIHFSGGDAAWQRAMFEEALGQGFPPEAITCADYKSPVIAAMPDHIRRRLMPTPPEDEDAPEAPVPVPDAPVPPAPAYRP